MIGIEPIKLGEQRLADWVVGQHQDLQLARLLDTGEPIAVAGLQTSQQLQLRAAATKRKMTLVE